MPSLGIDIGGTSIKLACIGDDGATLWTARSPMYARPDRAALIHALQQAAASRATNLTTTGLCVPGLLDKRQRLVTLSVNVPGLVNQPLDTLLRDAFGPTTPPPALLTDANAAAYDLHTARRLAGRLMLLVLGTGIGASVIDDDGSPLAVDGDSPGHFGQLDCSLDDAPPLGPDHGAGSLEGYLGVAALRARYGDDFPAKLPTLPITEPPFRALARAIRIGHALYRPHHVALAGGIGIALAPRLGELRQLVDQNLTNIARPAWTLTCGDHDHHAALGAAKYAMSHR